MWSPYSVHKTLGFMLIWELGRCEVHVSVQLFFGVARKLVALAAPGNLVEALGELLVKLQRIIFIHL